MVPKYKIKFRTFPLGRKDVFGLKQAFVTTAAKFCLRYLNLNNYEVN